MLNDNAISDRTPTRQGWVDAGEKEEAGLPF